MSKLVSPAKGASPTENAIKAIHPEIPVKIRRANATLIKTILFRKASLPMRPAHGVWLKIPFISIIVSRHGLDHLS